MKKLSVLVSLVMILALAAPAFAGINTDITGSVTGKVRYDQQSGFTTYGKTEAKVTMSAGSEGNIKAVVNLGGTTAKSEGAFGGDSSPFIGNTNVLLKVDSAWIESTGAWIQGGPDVVTKIGSLNPNYSNWIADFGNTTYPRIDAVEVSQLDLGGLSLTGLMGWYDNDTATASVDTHSINALALNGGLDVVDLGVVYVVETEVASKTNISTDYAVTAGIDPADGVSVDATFASNGANNATAYKVSGELATVPNVTFTASAWSAAANFDPAWANRKDDKLTEAPTAFTKDQIGYQVGVETTQSGLDLSASYKNTTKADKTGPVTETKVGAATTVSETDLSADVTMNSTWANTKIVASAKRSFGNVNGSYTLTLNDGGAAGTKHEIAADTTVDTPLADGVKLEGKVILDGSTTNFGGDATWTAPNGVILGLSYANYDRGDSWPGGYNVTNDANGADGFAAHAGIEVAF